MTVLIIYQFNGAPISMQHQVLFEGNIGRIEGEFGHRFGNTAIHCQHQQGITFLFRCGCIILLLVFHQLAVGVFLEPFHFLGSGFNDDLTGFVTGQDLGLTSKYLVAPVVIIVPVAVHDNKRGLPKEITGNFCQVPGCLRSLKCVVYDHQSAKVNQPCITDCSTFIHGDGSVDTIRQHLQSKMFRGIQIGFHSSSFKSLKNNRLLLVHTHPF